jgi:hypothetical protein
VPGTYFYRGVGEKLDRAEVHRETLKGMLRTYLDDNMTGWRAKLDHSGQWDFSGGGKQNSDLAWSVVVGDIVHNLRSALEHLAGALLEGNHKAPTDDTTFPVMERRLTTKRAGVKALPNIKPGGIQDPARVILDGVQPYTYGDDFALHELWLLHKMWNYDKHKLVLVQTPWLLNTYAARDAERPSFMEGNLVCIRRAEDSATFRLWPDPAWANVNVYLETTLQIGFGLGTPAEQQPIYSTLTTIADFVRDRVVNPLLPYAD